MSLCLQPGKLLKKKCINNTTKKREIMDNACNFCGSDQIDIEDLRPHNFGNELTGDDLGQICNYCFETYIK